MTFYQRHEHAIDTVLCVLFWTVLLPICITLLIATVFIIGGTALHIAQIALTKIISTIK